MALDASALLHQQHLFGLDNNNNNNNYNYNDKDPYPSLLGVLDNNTWSTTLLQTSYYDINDNNNHFIDDYHGIINNNDNDDDNDDGIMYTNNYDDVISEAGLFSTTLDNYEWGSLDSSSPEVGKTEIVVGDRDHGLPMEVEVEVVMRPPRTRRATAKKTRVDVENQRMTHIAVERNRRKQMNLYLNMLRSLMPHSYVQRGDQASIVGGAINFVKELEHKLHYLSAKKHGVDNLSGKGTSSSTSLPFQEFITFPQYSGLAHSCDDGVQMKKQALGGGDDDGVAGDVEVTMVERHANLKIRMKKQQQPKQLSKLVSGLLCLKLTILHLNVNTSQGLVFYSFNLKVEDESKMSTVDEIAGAVHNLLCRIQDDQSSLIC